jgi:putative hydrolase of the HAD superfamily
VYAIERVRYQPKPSLRGFRHLLRAERVVAHRAVMVDDSLPNLLAARKLGMRTVWVSSVPRVPGYVDAKVNSVRQLPRLLDEFGGSA